MAKESRQPILKVELDPIEDELIEEQEDNVETFEQYCYMKCNPQDLEMTRMMIKKLGLGGYLTTCSLDIERMPQYCDPMATYNFIVGSCLTLYKACENKEFLTLRKRIEVLVRGMYELDSWCGIKDEVHPEMDEDKLFEVLSKLDMDRERYKQIFMRNYQKIDGIEARNLFIKFAKLLFTFNGYRAPLRTDPKKAYQDAIGLTDLFGEFLEEVGVR